MAARSNVVWITGAGSGMGRAVAESAAGHGYLVALSGRRVDALEETATTARGAGGKALVAPMDATSNTEVGAVHSRQPSARVH